MDRRTLACGGWGMSALAARGVRVVAVVVLAGAGCVTVGGLGGCSKPLLAPTDVRSPFDRYDAVRSQYAQQYVEDKFGRRQPNLRARLAPKE